MKTAKERKRDSRDRHAAIGLKRLEMWVYPEIEDKVKKFAEKERKKLERAREHSYNE